MSYTNKASSGSVTGNYFLGDVNTISEPDSVSMSITSALNMLDSELSALSNSIEALAGKISPVLYPAEQPVNCAASSPGLLTSPVASDLYEKARCVIQMRLLVADLVDRVSC